MDKVAYYKDQIYKQAASFNAKRGKQYWQMLKRLYGGTDEAVKAIKETGDTGIYHGTKAENIGNILSEGLKRNGSKRGFDNEGNGIYFGDRSLASGYGGGLVRFKKPSELRITKSLYPKMTKVTTTAVKANPRKISKELRETDTYGMKKLYRNYGNNTIRYEGQDIPMKDVHPNILSGIYNQQHILDDPKLQRKYLNKEEYTKYLSKKKKRSPEMKKIVKDMSTSRSHLSLTDRNQFLVRTKHIDPQLITKAE